MKLDAILRACSNLRVESPPVLWEMQAREDAFPLLLGKMFVFVSRQSRAGEPLALCISNVVIPAGGGTLQSIESVPTAIPAGEYVAVTVCGSGDSATEFTWQPGSPPVSEEFAELIRFASRSGAVCLYTRNRGGQGSITAFFLRRDV
jgi:hypothetical protein